MRRSSARIRDIPAEKRPFYGSEERRKRSSGEDEEAPKTKKALLTKLKKIETETKEKILEAKPLVEENGNGDDVRRVKETLRLFNLHYLRFTKEEDLRYSKPQEVGDKRRSRRPDLKAMEKMRSNNEILHPIRILGPIPGIKVGFQFFSRTEMVTVGMHGHWLGGIDYISKSKINPKEKMYEGYTFPLALAIVLSGQYQDDVDNSEEIVYTGQGGHDLLGNKQQIKDQVMSSGNLALKNSMNHSVPVRVVRGHKCENSYTKKVYTYDGLYKVVDYWAEKGVAGFTVFKYRLKRIPGQPNLATNEVRFVRGKGSRAQSEIPGLVCSDISNGLEAIPIPVTNVIEDPPTVPDEGFTYMTTTEISSDIKMPPSAVGCKCKDKCTDPEICACAKLNNKDFPYVVRDGGRLIEPKDIVFECGPNCGCGPECVNRTSQRGPKYRLEVYRTFDKGWAVRSWDYIPSGAPVCEYIGVLRKSDDMDITTGNEYIFEIDCLQTINEMGRRERRLGDVRLLNSKASGKNGDIPENPQFCIDSGTKGNVTRFINHSCEPNLFVQCILSSHHDLTLARIVLFAAETIVPLQELSYDYGFELNSVVDSDGNIKRLTCHCGASSCTGRLY